MISRDTYNFVNHAASGIYELCCEIFQRADVHPPATQPIPAPVGPAASDVSTTKEVSENEDSITEEIAELRAAESSHKEWVRILLFPILSYMIVLFVITFC